MVPVLRQQYNQRFSEAAYQALLNDIEKTYPGKLDFRIAETPIFLPKTFTAQMLQTCEAVIDVITQPGYHDQSTRAIPEGLQVPGEDTYPHCIAFDFGVCTGADGALEPQLIELQGFPSLFCFQIFFPELHARHFPWPKGYSTYLNGFDKESYIGLLKKMIIAGAAPEEAILLEIFPDTQKTRIDFSCTETYLGIKTVCLTALIKEGNELFYERDGKKQRIKRIYNRLIFDDLMHQPQEVQDKAAILFEPLDVQWVPHPAWFYRVSKFTLPFIRHRFVPRTQFLSDVKDMPKDLENYVLKPLFSFAGQGVHIDIAPEDLKNIADPHNWILQQKVPYADVVQTPEEPAKAEIRLFYFWEKGAARPVAVTNLARLSKGKMIGVRYNKDKTWVGGSFALFEQ